MSDPIFEYMYPFGLAKHLLLSGLVEFPHIGD